MSRSSTHVSLAEQENAPYEYPLVINDYSQVINLNEHLYEAYFKRGGCQVQSVAFTPDGKRLISGGYDGVVNVWQMPWE
ncbi:MAG: hypothetical protein ACOC0N_01085 [Chroococcales cyanobacterium]